MNERVLMDLPLWSDPKAKELFEKMCTDAGVSPAQIGELIALLREYQHMDRARGIYDDFDICLNQGDELCE